MTTTAFGISFYENLFEHYLVYVVFLIYVKIRKTPLKLKLDYIVIPINQNEDNH
jgi:hypothetical protein